jgi:hypothetical protein
MSHKNKTNEMRGKDRIWQNKKRRAEILTIRRKRSEYEKQRGRKQPEEEGVDM